jgi:hypothetical protein
MMILRMGCELLSFGPTPFGPIPYPFGGRTVTYSGGARRI